MNNNDVLDALVRINDVLDTISEQLAKLDNRITRMADGETVAHTETINAISDLARADGPAVLACDDRARLPVIRRAKHLEQLVEDRGGHARLVGQHEQHTLEAALVRRDGAQTRANRAAKPGLPVGIRHEGDVQSSNRLRNLGRSCAEHGEDRVTATLQRDRDRASNQRATRDRKQLLRSAHTPRSPRSYFYWMMTVIIN